MKDQDYIQYEAYLSNELSKDKAVEFKNRLKRDSEFNKAFNIYKELHVFLEHKFEYENTTDAFKSNLKTISNSHFNKTETTSKKTQKGKSFNFYKYTIAACIIVLFGIFTFNQFSSPVYADYANYDAISLTVRGENDDLLKQAENAFNSKDFKKALKLFDEIYDKDILNYEIKLYKSIALIEANQFLEAEKLLRDIEGSNSAYKNKAKWYLALSKLKQKDYDACLKILKTIPEDADDHKQAKKLIKKID